ncbi:MAG: hypothetical protein H8E55_51415 [Pelagibacterales bacterium]|nr:hypothetical protein [Pelagibacterales bacterium]
MKILKIENDEKLLKVVRAFFRDNVDVWRNWSFNFYDKVNARIGEKILDYFWEKEFGKRKNKKTLEDFDNEMKKYLNEKTTNNNN